MDVAELITVPDLGRRMQIGELYDARSEKSAGGFLWPPQDLRRYITTTPAQFSAYAFAEDDTFEHKARLLDIGMAMKLSLNSGMVDVDGSARYLFDRKTTTRAVRMSAGYKVRTIKQTLDVFHPDLNLNSTGHGMTQVTRNNIATHVVVAVTWGADCVATFEHGFGSMAERELIAGHLSVAIRTGFNDIHISTSYLNDNNASARMNSTKVRLHGDVVPFGNDTLPTTPAEALQFMKNLHLHGLNGGGVPMKLTLMPIAWIDSTAARLVRAITAQMVDRAAAIFDEFDESEAIVKDLLAIPADGFLKWRWEVGDWLQQITTWRAEYTQRLKGAVIAHRSGIADTTVLSEMLQEYDASEFSLLKVREEAEKQRDTIMNLKAMVKQLRNEGSVTIAESFSHAQAPTLDGTYDRVYMLVLVGMNPASARATINVVREFAVLARSRLSSIGGAGVDHCVEEVIDGTLQCVEAQKFVSLHFETFCHQLCNASFCDEGYRRCSGSAPNPTGPTATPLGPAWCHCPTTEVLEYVRSTAPVRVTDTLPALPGKPVVISHTGEQEGERNPMDQKMHLTLTSSAEARLDLVRNFRVRVIWSESSVVGNVVTWTRHGHTFDTYSNSPNIVVRPLVAGRRYTFLVSGVNHVGQGPESEEYPALGPVMVMQNMPIFQPQAPLASSQNNTAPAWKVQPVQLTMSTKAHGLVNLAILRTRDGSIECAHVAGESVWGFNCTLPRLGYTEPETIVRVDIYAASDEHIGWGNLTVHAPSARACHIHEARRKVYCNLTNTCVEDCSACKINNDGTKLREDADGYMSCSADQCVGHGRLWCPEKPQEDPCVDRDDSALQQGCEACGLGSLLGMSGEDCVLPCEVMVPAMVNGVICSTVLPGESCPLVCANGYHSTGHERINFTCPQNNTIREWAADVSTLGCVTSNAAWTTAGTIVMWSGSIAEIPQYWALCDGTNDTPDLTERFVQGCSSRSSCGASGGSNISSATTSRAGSHDHGGRTDPHTLTIAEMPIHSHHIRARANGGAEYGWGWNGDHGGMGNSYSQNAGGDQPHRHGIQSSGNHDHVVAVDVTPPYYSLAFIMYKGPAASQ